MRGRNLRRTLVAAGLVAASAVLVLVLAVAGLLAFIVTSAGAGSSWNASMDELSAALVRQVAADVLNGGLEERYALAVEVPPEAETLTLEGDASLLRRALLNLVNNCVRHNTEGCAITLTAAAEGEVCTLRVEDDGGGGLPVGLAEVGLAPDGGAAHGTGLRLVEQIARAHGGALELHRAARGVLAVLRLPL